MTKLKPVLTEKSYNSYNQNKIATFNVSLHLNKIEISKLVKDEFKVNVIEVKTLNRLGKFKMARNFRQIVRKSPDIKLAYVKIAKGDKIDIFESSK